MTTTNTRPWFVSFETRQRGAIGNFETRGLSTMADSKYDAMRIVREDLNNKGFETRYPVKVYQYEENET
jgi:hypothetical protein